jgi:hypothetical protein
MKRRYIRESFTDEELANIKAGKCWCGKPKSEFQKGMIAYCSPDHRTIWQSKIMTWQEFRDEFVREHGEKCDSCGVESTQVEKDKLYKQKQHEKEEFLKAMKPQVQDAIIARKIDKLEANYERDFASAIDPANIDIYDIERYARLHRIPIPELPPYYQTEADKKIVFEVDHIVAIVNGGKEFDKGNLQVLCSDCHKKKTKQDLQIANDTHINLTNTQSSIEESLK